MSIHIFSFDQDSPISEQQSLRIQQALDRLLLSSPTDIEEIIDLLFRKKYDVSIILAGNIISDIDISKTRSKYEFGSLTIA